MKLHSLEIENFRAIKHLELDFTDELSRPRLMTLIVGPNGSGKTSIFDAIDIFDFDEQTDLHNILGARGKARKSIERKLESESIFDKVGSVCYLDQRRTVKLEHSIFNNKNHEDLEHNEVLSLLYKYYSRHITWNEEKFGESYWTRVKRLFNKICSPSELIRFESGPDSDTLIFSKNGLEYDLYQMSSGEHQILRILVGLTSAIAENSIVLIDEIELNLHPTWQKRLIRALRDDTDNNQYIFTTHSPDVIGLFYDSEIIRLGKLSE